MTELTDRLKKLALEIYKESDKCENNNEAMRYRTHMLKQVDIKERHMVREYVTRIGEGRQRRAIRGIHRGDTAVAIDKGNMDGGGG